MYPSKNLFVLNNLSKRQQRSCCSSSYPFNHHVSYFHRSRDLFVYNHFNSCRRWVSKRRFLFQLKWMWSSHRHWILSNIWLFISNGKMEIPLLMCMAQKLCQQRTAFKPFSLNTVCLVIVFSFLNIIINPNKKHYYYYYYLQTKMLYQRWLNNDFNKRRVNQDINDLFCDQRICSCLCASNICENCGMTINKFRRHKFFWT